MNKDIIKNKLIKAGVYSFIIGSTNNDNQNINFIILSKKDIKKLIKKALKIIYKKIRCHSEALLLLENISDIVSQYAPIYSALTTENLDSTVSKFSSRIKFSVIDNLIKAIEDFAIVFSEKENNFMEGISLINTINNQEDSFYSTIRGIKPFKEILGGLPLEKIFSNSNQWTVGTIGLIKGFPDSTKNYLVSNFHVLCEDYYIENGEYIYSPNANTLENKIGHVPRQININLFKKDASKNNVDLAIGVIENDGTAITDATLVNENPNIYVKLDFNDYSPEIDEILYKYGARTNLTSGKVVAKNCYAQFEYPGMGILSFDNLITMSSGCHQRSFALPGDSGSIVFKSPYKDEDTDLKSTVIERKHEIQKSDFQNTRNEATSALVKNISINKELNTLISDLDSINDSDLDTVNQKLIIKIKDREDKINILISSESCCDIEALLKELAAIRKDLKRIRKNKAKVTKKDKIFNTINNLAKELNGIESRFRSILEEYDYPESHELDTDLKSKIVGMIFGGTFNTLGFGTNSLFPTESNYVLVQPWEQIEARLKYYISIEKIISKPDTTPKSQDDD